MPRWANAEFPLVGGWSHCKLPWTAGLPGRNRSPAKRVSHIRPSPHPVWCLQLAGGAAPQLFPCLPPQKLPTACTSTSLLMLQLAGVAAPRLVPSLHSHAAHQPRPAGQGGAGGGTAGSVGCMRWVGGSQLASRQPTQLAGRQRVRLAFNMHARWLLVRLRTLPRQCPPACPLAGRAVDAHGAGRAAGAATGGVPPPQSEPPAALRLSRCFEVEPLL